MGDAAAMITQQLSSKTSSDVTPSSASTLPPLMTLAERLEAQFRLIAQPKTLDVFLKTVKFFMSTTGSAAPDDTVGPNAAILDKEVVEKVNVVESRSNCSRQGKESSTCLYRPR